MKKKKSKQVLWKVRFAFEHLRAIRSHESFFITTDRALLAIANFKAERILNRRAVEFPSAQIVSVEHVGTIADE